MAIVQCRPTSPGRRHLVKVKTAALSSERPQKNLTIPSRPRVGRNNSGRITTRHRGAGHKRLYRVVDFKRVKDGIPAKVERLEYDPCRSAHIALVCYRDGERRYILAPEGLNVGDFVESGHSCPIRVGNTLALQNIPTGTTIHNIELKTGRGGQLVRAAGASAQLISKIDDYAVVRLRSGEMRKILITCRATIGSVGRGDFNLRKLGKAGASRWRGIRPTVRGTAMNPVDHPHGGGEGRTFGKHPVTPWGIGTKGKKTRRNKRTDKFIIKRRTA